MSNVLRRIGQGLVSFGTGIPQIELDRMALVNEGLETRNQANQAALAGFSAQQDKDRRIAALRRDASTGNYDAMQRLAAESPDDALKLVELAGLTTDQQLDDAGRWARQALVIKDPVQLEAAIQQRVMDVESRGGDASASRSILDLPIPERPAALQVMASAIDTVNNIPAELRTFEGLLESARSDDPMRAQAAGVALGNIPRAGSQSATERIANTPGQTETVAESQATIREATTTGEGMAKRKLSLPQAKSRRAASRAKFEGLAKAAQSILDDDALWQAVGFGRGLSLIPSSAGARVKSKIDNLRSKAGLAVLQDIRDNSKTGGAVGQVSNFEQKLFQDNIAPLASLNVSPEDYRSFVQGVIDYANDAAKRVDDSFLDTYPELQEAKPEQDDDFQKVWDAAKSGDVLEAPDGTLRRKP